MNRKWSIFILTIISLYVANAVSYPVFADTVEVCISNAQTPDARVLCAKEFYDEQWRLCSGSKRPECQGAFGSGIKNLFNLSSGGREKRTFTRPSEEESRRLREERRRRFEDEVNERLEKQTY